MSYTVTGPYLNGSSPPLNAEFFNGIETFLALINSAAVDANITADGNGLQTLIKQAINPGSTVLNGSTAGTATLYQPLTGIFKAVVVIQAGFRNGGGAAQTLAIPTGFTLGFRWWVGDTNTFAFKSASTARNSNIITALASGGGTISSQTDIASHSIGECNFSVDTVSFNSGAASAHTGVLVMLGI
jgi:hypothetical protein